MSMFPVVLPVLNRCFYGMMQLQRKIKVEKFLGGANKQQDPRNSNDEATPPM